MNATAPETHLYPQKTKPTPLRLVLNAISGGLIGMAEMVPGISGGTLALVIGVYERALHNGNLLIELGKAVIKDRSQVKAVAQKIDWFFLITVGIGMVTALFTLSSVMHGFVTNYPHISRGLFFGMVLVSILVPLGMMDPKDFRRRKTTLIPVFILAVLIGFFATSFVSAPRENPSYLFIFVAAAVAVCALILPGLSGSFFLMAVGLYQPIMSSLSNRDWDVISIFILGAVTGIVLFVRFMDYLLEHKRTITLTIMAGLMLGSSRALWPWQDANANLQAPSEQVAITFAMMVLGALIVASIIFLEKISSKHIGSETVETTDPA